MYPRGIFATPETRATRKGVANTQSEGGALSGLIWTTVVCLLANHFREA